jgi:hypothetical protein
MARVDCRNTGFLQCLAAALIFSASGCTPPTAGLIKRIPDAQSAHVRWLPFIIDGQTDRGKIRAEFGEPTVQFLDSSLAGYRLILAVRGDSIQATELGSSLFEPYNPGLVRRVERLDQDGYLRVVHSPPDDQTGVDLVGRTAEYHLVLKFDSTGTLRRHILLRILP